MSNSLILFSYIDPVSGIILLQLAIGGCLGGLSFLYRKIGGGVRLTNPALQASVENDDPQHPPESPPRGQKV